MQETCAEEACTEEVKGEEDVKKGEEEVKKGEEDVKKDEEDVKKVEENDAQKVEEEMKQGTEEKETTKSKENKPVTEPETRETAEPSPKETSHDVAEESTPSKETVEKVKSSDCCIVLYPVCFTNNHSISTILCLFYLLTPTNDTRGERLQRSRYCRFRH